ncbi:hypothetical protein LTR08_000025 [Meristemomyces frigidus]|nr:hypothetical protein LTR08_000025 [Meristemomyces frigidus]
MFAVKGWSVDAASLKPQTEPFKSAKRTAEDGEQKQSRKRRREEGPAAPTADVGKLWDQHIEGKKRVRTKGASKKERKEPKAQGEPGGAEQQPAKPDGEGVEPPPKQQEDSEPRGKAEKKDKKKRKDTGEAPKPTTDGEEARETVVKAPPPVPLAPVAAKLTPMQAAMRQKLVSARFRHLNQTLYTAPSKTSLQLFDKNPEMFEDYHAGFRQQVSVWPENPVDAMIATIRTRGKVKPPKFDRNKKSKPDQPVETDSSVAVVLPRTQGTCIIADLGCGDARLAQTLKESDNRNKLTLKVHSFDLHSPSPLVTKADISQLPLADGSVDVAIFCLALMGTNWISFVEEAYRILHWKGELWVAEIKSRLGRVGKAGKVVEHSVGNKKKQAVLKKAQDLKKKDDEEFDENAALRTEVDGVETKQVETDVSAFVDVLRRRGFLLKDGDRSIDLSNKMFVKMEFVKAATATKGKGVPETDGKGGAKPEFKKKKFVEEASQEVTTDDEAKVLKPCLYKLR